MRRVSLGLAAALLAAGVAAHAMLVTRSGPRYTPPPPVAAEAINPLPDNYTLEWVYPRPAGSAPDLDANSRAFFAATGLTYEIPLVVTGGMPPYTFTVANEPEGMSVVSYTMASGATGSLLRWLNPTTDAADIELTVSDVHGHTAEVTYSVDVDDSRFRFVSTTGNDSNDGTAASPWRTLDKINTSSTGAHIIYFRGGTYDMDAEPNENVGNVNGEVRVAWSGSAQWLAYPGESPTIDFGFTGGPPYGDADDKPRIRFGGSIAVFQDGLTVDRPMVMAFHIATGSRRGNVAWRMTLTGIGAGVEGGNSAYFTWTRSTNTPRTNVALVSNTFSVLPGVTNDALKFYDALKPVVEGNLFTASASTELLALKGGVEQYTVRFNRFADQAGWAIGGNYANNDGAEVDGTDEPTYGEQSFNAILATGSGGMYVGAGHWNSEDGGRQDIYRNTIVGNTIAQEVDAGDGPINFDRNVIINSNTPKITRTDVTASGNVVETDNLTGTSSDGIVDSDGLLQGSYRTSHYGTAAPRGHEIAP